MNVVTSTNTSLKTKNNTSRPSGEPKIKNTKVVSNNGKIKKNNTSRPIKQLLRGKTIEIYPHTIPSWKW